MAALPPSPPTSLQVDGRAEVTNQATENTSGTIPVSAIIDDPAGYYVNLHNEAFPGGAIRGQLAASEPLVREAVALAGRCRPAGHPTRRSGPP